LRKAMTWTLAHRQPVVLALVRATGLLQCAMRIAAFFTGLKRSAEQLGALERCCRILSRALIKYLKGRVLKPPGGLLPAPA
jgi:hypothetical protein